MLTRQAEGTYGGRPIHIVSNRGPGQYEDETGPIKWLPGGLTMVLIPPVLSMVKRGVHTLWSAMPNTVWDRLRANSGELHPSGATGEEGVRAALVRFLKYTKKQQLHYYNQVANTRDWQGHHGGKHDLTREQLIKAEATSRHTWSQQARSIVENSLDDSIVQIHDFQLAGVGRRVLQELDKYNKRRIARGEAPKRLHLVGFWHIPFGTVDELLESFRETRDQCPRFKQYLTDLEAIPWGFHSEEWQHNYTSAFKEIFGREPETESFVQPALIDPQGLQEEASSQEVEEALTWVNEQLDEGLGGRKFNGEVITIVSRCDPKNGQPQSVRAFRNTAQQILDSLPPSVDPPALLMSAPRTRKGTPVFDAEWAQVEAEAKIAEEMGFKVVRLYDHAKGPESASRPLSVAAFRRATITLTPAERGGRDIVAQEAMGLKLPSDPPAALIVSAMAATSETLEGFYAEESLVIGTHPRTGQPIRRVSGSGLVKGAIVLGGIGPNVDLDTQAAIIGAGIKQAMLMPRAERLRRMEAMLESVRMENPIQWFGRLEVAAIDNSKKRGIIPVKTGRGKHPYRFLYSGPSEQTIKHLESREHRDMHPTGARIRRRGIGWEDFQPPQMHHSREEAFVPEEITSTWTERELKELKSQRPGEISEPLGRYFTIGLSGLEAAYSEIGSPIPPSVLAEAYQRIGLSPATKTVGEGVIELDKSPKTVDRPGGPTLK